MNLYCTLHEWSSHKQVGGASQPLPEATLRAHERTILLADIDAASRRVDAWCNRHFYPVLAQYYFDYIDARLIRFGMNDLVEAREVWTANGQHEVAAADYYLLTGNNPNLVVKSRLKVRYESGETLYIGEGWQQANSVVGVWAYHEQWANAWLDSLDTVKVELSASSSSLSVNQVSGVNGEGAAPRFQVGQTLQIGTEWMYVADTDDSTDIVTVARPQNGTDAAIHAAGAKIYIYRPMADVAKACRIITDFFRVIPQVGPTGKMHVAKGDTAVNLSIPTTAQQLLQPYRRVPIGSNADEEDARYDQVRYYHPIGSRYS